jgi:hypothetical protein
MPHIPSEAELPGNERPLIAPAEYLAEVVACSNTKKDGSLILDKGKNEMWGLTLKIASEGPYWGWTVFDYLGFSEAVLPRTREVFNALGFYVKNGFDANDPQMLVGKTAFINVIVDDYSGQKRNKVKFYDGYRATSQQQESLDDIPF